MQIPPGVAFTIDQLGAGLERAQSTIAQLSARVDELESENARLRAAQAGTSAAEERTP